MGVVLVAAGLAAVAACVWMLRYKLVVVRVDGDSMEPAYRDGDRVLVWRGRVAAIRHGDVIVARQPTDHRDGAARFGGMHRGLWMIKRVHALPGDPVPGGLAAALDAGPGERVPPSRFVVLGDNAGNSQDSRHFGYLPAWRVLGVGIRRLGSPAAGRQ